MEISTRPSLHLLCFLAPIPDIGKVHMGCGWSVSKHDVIIEGAVGCRLVVEVG